jgi:hypothetical protein
MEIDQCPRCGYPIAPTTTTTTYEVDVVGRMWMPQCHAATHVTIPAADLPEHNRPDDMTDLQHEAWKVECRVDMVCGDFSEIEGCEIIRCEKELTVQSSEGQGAGAGQTCTSTVTTRYTTIQPFTDEQAEVFADCMSEGWEDENA